MIDDGDETRGGEADWLMDISGSDDEPMPDIPEDVLRKAFGESPGSKLVVNSPDSMDRFEILAIPRRSWCWCLHCERIYPLGSYRIVEDLQMCPYSGCDGDAVLDLWAWQNVREGNPHYPEIPELSVVYPLYGEK